jgi:hypothetical protein
MEGLARCGSDVFQSWFRYDLHVLNILGLSLLDVRATHCSHNFIIRTFYQVTQEPQVSICLAFGNYLLSSIESICRAVIDPRWEAVPGGCIACC